MKKKIEVDPNKVIKVTPRMVKDNFKIMCQKKNLEVKLESVDPTGFIEKSKSFELEVIDDNECMKTERLILHVGDCLYRIDNKGLILERLVPHENN